jgi:hypothetical protein
MPIYSSNIRTRQAAVSGQYAESGGRIHPTEYVVHNEVGNLLPKLTELDHAGGRVDLCKCFLSIETDSDEQADDCYTYLDQTPADPLVDCVLLRPAPIGDRSGHVDERQDTQSFIEAYQIQGGLAPWYLRGLHVVGMRTITLWSREDVRLPQAGQTLYLVANEGESGEYGQYVQIASFTHETQTFSFSESGGCSLIRRRLISCSLTSALGYEFIGPEVACTDPSPQSIDVLIREVVVADASRYYGCRNLSVAASSGSTTVHLANIYGQIVPSARGEVPLTSVPALSVGTQEITSGNETFTVNGPVHTQRTTITAVTRANNYTRTLLPIPATGGLVRVHVRILDHWYTVVEGESNSVGTITCNRLSGATLLSLSALPDADTLLLWEWPSAIHFTDRVGTTQISPITIVSDLPGQPEIGTLTLGWISAGTSRTASESTLGSIGGNCTGSRVGSRVILQFAGGNIPDGGTQITYNYQPLETVVETITPQLANHNATFTLSQSPRPGSVQATWNVTRNQAVDSKNQSTTSIFYMPGSSGEGGSSIEHPGYKTSSTEQGTKSSETITKIANDDGAGHIALTGTVNYTTGACLLPVEEQYQASSYNIVSEQIGDDVVESGSWSSNSQTEYFYPPISVRYALAATVPGSQINGAIATPPLEIQFLQEVQDHIIPGTVRFSIGSVKYSDRDGTGGVLYLENGTIVGSFDYLRKTAVLTYWTSAVSVTVQSMLSTYGQFSLTQANYRTSTAPLVPASFEATATQEDGGLVVATGNLDGSLTGDGVTSGTIDHDLGIVTVTFDEPVYPGTIKYSAVAYTLIPLDPSIIGIDPVRLPPDGRVPIIRTGDYAVVFEDGVTTLPTAVGGATVAMPENHLAHVILEDSIGEQTYILDSGVLPDDTVQIPTNGRLGPLEYCVLEDSYGRPLDGSLYDADLNAWTIHFSATYSAEGLVEPYTVRYLALVDPDSYRVDLSDGTITWSDPIDLTGYTQPIKANWRKHDISLVAEAQTTGTVQLLSSLLHSYSTAAKISALLVHGDLVARVQNAFVENSTPTNWADYQQTGAPSGGASYDFTGYPIQVFNSGAIRQRWRIKRRSDGQWDVIGEYLGVIVTWPGTSTLEARSTPSQVRPYFTLYSGGLGSGWATGNIIQFETLAAHGPIWVLRSVRPGQPTVAQDSIRVCHRVGVD